MLKYMTTGLAALLLSTAANAETAVISVTGGAPAIFVNNPGNTVGFSFTVNQNITVSALGLYDFSSDFGTGRTASGTLEQSHQVGIFSSSGSLLASATVGAATPVTNGYAYTNISNLNLVSGQSYLIGGYYTGRDNDAYLYNATSVLTSTAITFGGAAFFEGSALSAPTNVNANSVGRFGPNFQFSLTPSSAVPEPASWAMMMIGVGVVGGAARRRRISAKVAFS